MNPIRYQYVTVRRRRNPVTIAYTSAEENGQIVITLGASFCHSTDRFNRIRGRGIAEGRMSRAPFRFSIPFDRTQTNAYGKAVADGLRDFVSSHHHQISATYSRKS
jgi:hypothetical protein